MGDSSSEIMTKINRPIPGNEVGVWLRYDPVYDLIRKYGTEEDDGTRRQEWEAEPKHADWQEVEKLCLEVLAYKSKDLQVLAWFMEAYQHQNGLSGLSVNILIFLSFVKNFWEKAFPGKEDDPDQTFRTHIVESMLRCVQTVVITDPLNELKFLFSQPPSLAKCYEADNLEKLSKRGGVAAEVFQKALDNGLITMERIRKAFHEVDKSVGMAKVAMLDECLANLREAEKIIRDSVGDEAPRFGEFASHLKELKGLYGLCARENEVSEKNPKELLDTGSAAALSENAIASEARSERTEGTRVSDRSGIYKAIRDIGEFLFETDPHSPSPILLRTIGGWENRNLAEIIADLQKATPEVKSLFVLLSKACQADKD